MSEITLEPAMMQCAGVLIADQLCKNGFLPRKFTTFFYPSSNSKAFVKQILLARMFFFNTSETLFKTRLVSMLSSHPRTDV